MASIELNRCFNLRKYTGVTSSFSAQNEDPTKSGSCRPDVMQMIAAQAARFLQQHQSSFMRSNPSKFEHNTIQAPSAVPILRTVEELDGFLKQLESNSILDMAITYLQRHSSPDMSCIFGTQSNGFHSRGKSLDIVDTVLESTCRGSVVAPLTSTESDHHEDILDLEVPRNAHDPGAHPSPSPIPAPLSSSSSSSSSSADLLTAVESRISLEDVFRVLMDKPIQCPDTTSSSDSALLSDGACPSDATEVTAQLLCFPIDPFSSGLLADDSLGPALAYLHRSSESEHYTCDAASATIDGTSVPDRDRDSRGMGASHALGGRAQSVRPAKHGQQGELGLRDIQKGKRWRPHKPLPNRANDIITSIATAIIANPLIGTSNAIGKGPKRRKLGSKTPKTPADADNPDALGASDSTDVGGSMSSELDSGGVGLRRGLRKKKPTPAALAAGLMRRKDHTVNESGLPSPVKQSQKSGKTKTSAGHLPKRAFTRKMSNRAHTAQKISNTAVATPSKVKRYSKASGRTNGGEKIRKQGLDNAERTFGADISKGIGSSGCKATAAGCDQSGALTDVAEAEAAVAAAAAEQVALLSQAVTRAEAYDSSSSSSYYVSDLDNEEGEEEENARYELISDEGSDADIDTDTYDIAADGGVADDQALSSSSSSLVSISSDEIP